MEDTWDFKKEFGFEPPRPLGDRVCIMRYTKKYSETIASCEEADRRAEYESIVGRIVKLGSACFKGDSFNNWDKEDLYKVGDFVTFKVNPGTWFKYGKEDIRIKVEQPRILSPISHISKSQERINDVIKKRPVLTIVFDDAINSIIENPDYVERE